MVTLYSSCWPLNNQFWELGSIPSGFYLQGEEIVVVARDLIGFQSIFPRIWIMRTGQRKTRPWNCIFRYVNINLIRRENGRVVINVLDVYFNHADLLVVGKHFHRELALGVSLAQRFSVNALLCMRCRILQHPEVGFLSLPSRPSLLQSKSGIFGNVSNDSSRTLFLWDRVSQVFQCQGLSP
uniref:Uncharacterized protein n=1 Tax=Hippocampus comes TaxID=109280 RepID=A0A3Q2YK57_HIPCM